MALLLGGCNSDAPGATVASSTVAVTAPMRADQAAALSAASSEALEMIEMIEHPRPCRREPLSALARRSRVVETPWQQARAVAGRYCADPEVSGITAYDQCGSHRVLVVGYKLDADLAYYNLSSGKLEAFVHQGHVLGICTEYGERPALDLAKCEETPLCEGERLPN